MTSFPCLPYLVRMVRAIVVLFLALTLLTSLSAKSAEPVMDDARTEAALTNLLNEAGPFPGVTLKVRMGVVIVDGVVANEKQLDFLQKAAERMPSVISVVNRTKSEERDAFDLSPAISEGSKMADRLKRAIPAILTVAIILMFLFIVGKLIARGNSWFWKRRIQNPFLQATVSRLTLWPIWILFFYLTLQTAGLSGFAATIIGGTGVLGIILGLAFKGIAENYLAGLLLATRAPFTKGDLIEVDQYTGYVQNLNMRGTTIIDLNGHLILIPNSTVIQSVVQNQTANPKIRTSFNIAITYRDSIAQAQEVLIQAMKSVRGTLSEPEPDVIVDNFQGSGVCLKVRTWFNVKETNELRYRSRAMAIAKETLLAKGFTIPSDLQEVVFTDALKVRVLDSNEAVETASQERKDQIIEQAAVHLNDNQNIESAPDTQAQDLMKLAQENPLLKNYATGEAKEEIAGDPEEVIKGRG